MGDRNRRETGSLGLLCTTYLDNSVTALTFLQISSKKVEKLIGGGP